MAKKKVGRPSEYTQEKADYICERLSGGKSLRSVLKEPGMPDGATVFKWMRTHEEFLKQYARAKEESADALVEEMMDISDDGIKTIITGGKEMSSAVAQMVRLKVDTRKWVASKLKPKKYGDKLDLSNNGKDFPTPILGVLSNDINKENSEAN